MSLRQTAASRPAADSCDRRRVLSSQFWSGSGDSMAVSESTQNSFRTALKVACVECKIPHAGRMTLIAPSMCGNLPSIADSWFRAAPSTLAGPWVACE